MTPAARIAAAIDLLDAVEAAPNRPADAVANEFFRARRYIGSGDRRAVSDRVWQVLRARRRLAWWIDNATTPDAKRGDARPNGAPLDEANAETMPTQSRVKLSHRRACWLPPRCCWRVGRCLAFARRSPAASSLLPGWHDRRPLRCRASRGTALIILPSPRRSGWRSPTGSCRT